MLPPLTCFKNNNTVVFEINMINSLMSLKLPNMEHSQIRGIKVDATIQMPE